MAVPARVDVWKIDVPKHTSLDLLSAEERTRAERYLREAKQVEFTVSRSALRRVLSLYLGVPETEIEVPPPAPDAPPPPVAAPPPPVMPPPPVAAPDVPPAPVAPPPPDAPPSAPAREG